jgi:hypothetical protein
MESHYDACPRREIFPARSTIRPNGSLSEAEKFIR